MYGILKNFAMIKTSIHPKRPKRIISPATTSVINLTTYPKYRVLAPFKIIPIVIWKIPKMTDIFILTLLTNVSLLFVTDQIGSIPNGYVHSGEILVNISGGASVALL